MHTITRDSLANFEIGCVVEYNQAFGVCCRIVEKIIHVMFEDVRIIKIHYRNLHVVSYPNEMNSGKPWNNLDTTFVKEHMEMSNTDLSKILGRSPESVGQKKFKIREENKIK